MKEEYFKQDSKQVIDMIFDAKMFKDDMTRDDMKAVEDLLCYLLESKFDTYKRLAKLMESINKPKK